MKQFLFAAFTAIIIHASANCQKQAFKPGFSVTMDTSKASGLLSQCSRSIPQKIVSLWMPAKNDIDLLESNFHNIDKVIARECCVTGLTIDSLQGYGFQYLGVIIKGKKYIYINAFPYDGTGSLKSFYGDPSTIPIVVCDGGTSYWGVLFDPTTKQFSSLAFNGYG